MLKRNKIKMFVERNEMRKKMSKEIFLSVYHYISVIVNLSLHNETLFQIYSVLLLIKWNI